MLKKNPIIQFKNVTKLSPTVSNKKIVIYKSDSGKIKLRVNLNQRTVWLNQKQISQLFGVKRPAITKHLNNIFKTNELKENSVCSILEHTAKDRKKYKTKFYNLDAIISVGYRVNSKKATQFRIWATNILKKYLIRGYVSNQRRLSQLQQTIKIITIKSKHKLLRGHETKIIDLLNTYSLSFKLLEQYDNRKISKPKLKSKSIYQLKTKDINHIISKLKDQFKKQSLLGQPYSDKFNSIILNINQTFNNKELYPSIEEKAANLLYMFIKDHPFVDGNKRIASAVFIFFLSKNNYLNKTNGQTKINNNTLTALSLLLAISDPKEKDIMINLIINLIK